MEPIARETVRSSTSTDQTDCDGALSSLYSFYRRFVALTNRLSKAEEVASLMELDLYNLLKNVGGRIDENISDNLAPPSRNQSSSARRCSEWLEAAVSALEIRFRADGLAEIQVDEGKKFTLPFTLAALLSILSLDVGTSNDDLVGWKSLDAVADLLSKQTGKQITRHGVSQNLYRLRKELFSRARTNPLLVQTNRQQGMRFALKRKTEPVIESDGR